MEIKGITGYLIIQISRDDAIKAVLHGSRVYSLNLDEFEKVREIEFMPIAEILGEESKYSILYFEVVPEETR